MKRKAIELMGESDRQPVKRMGSEPTYPAGKPTMTCSTSPLQGLTSRGSRRSDSSRSTSVDEIHLKRSNSSTDSSASSESDELENFQEVIDSIDFEGLKTVALRVRRELQEAVLQSSEGLYILPDDLSCEIDSIPRHGTFNLVYTVIFSDGLRWAARIPGHGAYLEELDKTKMKSEYESMRLVKEKTTIPIPEIYYLSLDASEIGSAFALMEIVHGFQLHHLWGTTLTKHERLRILNDIAKHMSQLQKLRYNQYGILRFSDKGLDPAIGPQIYFASSHAGNNEVPWGESYEDEPCGSYAEQLRSGWDDCEGFNKRGKCDMPILDLAVESIPAYMDSACVKALHMPDLNLHNIIVDKNGTVVAFLDWDMVGVSPTSAGCAKFPPWISQDWVAPIQFLHDNGGDGEDDEMLQEANERLSNYRKYYAAAYARYAACRVDDYDPRTTSASHILEAIDSALTHRFSRAAIVCKLLEHVFVRRAAFHAI